MERMKRQRFNSPGGLFQNNLTSAIESIPCEAVQCKMEIVKKRLSNSYLLLMILCLSTTAFAAEKTVISLVPLEGKKIGKETRKAVTNLLQDALFKTNAFILVERNRLKKVLKEQSLKQQGITREQAAKVGKLLGADKIILGSIRRRKKEFSDIGTGG